MRIIKSLVLLSFSISILGCQSQQTTKNIDLETPKNNTKTTEGTRYTNQKLLPAPCKNFSTPLVKDTSKLKKMLLAEGKINKDMTETEIKNYITEYIKNKSTTSCKPYLKKSAITPIIESIQYV